MGNLLNATAKVEIVGCFFFFVTFFLLVGIFFSDDDGNGMKIASLGVTIGRKL